MRRVRLGKKKFRWKERNSDDALERSGIRIVRGYADTEAQAYAEKNHYLFEDAEADASGSGLNDKVYLKISGITESENGVKAPYNTVKEGRDYGFYVVAFCDGRVMFETETVRYSIKKETEDIFDGTSITGNITLNKKGFTVKWKKQEAVGGYQIQYSTDSGFAEKMSFSKFKKNKGAAMLAVRNLKTGKRYYVRIRSYKIMDGVVFYSGWSGSRSVVTK